MEGKFNDMVKRLKPILKPHHAEHIAEHISAEKLDFELDCSWGSTLKSPQKRTVTKKDPETEKRLAAVRKLLDVVHLCIHSNNRASNHVQSRNAELCQALFAAGMNISENEQLSKRLIVDENTGTSHPVMEFLRNMNCDDWTDGMKKTLGIIMNIAQGRNATKSFDVAKTEFKKRETGGTAYEGLFKTLDGR